MRELASELRAKLGDPVCVVESLALSDGMKRQSRGLMIRCPWHAERTPSCSVTVGPDGTLRVHCFGCGHSGDVLHLVAAARGLDVRRDFRRVIEEAAQLAGGDLDDAPRPRRPAPPSRQRPPAAEIAEVWAACIAVYDDPEICGALKKRAIDPADVTDRELARALPATAIAPGWARYGRQSWADLGHRLVLPMYDADGKMATLHARRLGDGARDCPKGLSPAGFSIAGTVFADPLGRLLLAGEPVPWWTANAVVISEGAPDFLTVATHYSDADEDAPAVLGVISGSFTAAIGARVPSGATVTIRTHDDAAGDKYAAAVAGLLRGRCSVRRAAE